MSTMTSEQVASVQAELDSVKQSFQLGDLDDDGKCMCTFLLLVLVTQ